MLQANKLNHALISFKPLPLRFGQFGRNNNKVNVTHTKPFGAITLYSPSQRQQIFPGFFATQTEKLKNEVGKRYTPLTAAPPPITSFQPTLFNSFTTLFKQQRRERTGSPSFTVEQDFTRLAYLLAALAAIAIGTLLAYAFSSEQDLSLTTQRLRQSFVYLTTGLGITAVSARAFFNSPIFWRLATMNPWASLAITFAGTFGTMIATTAIPYENTVPKHLAYVAFNSMIGLSLCPVVSLGGPLLLKAAFATGCVVSALGLTAAASPEGSFLSWGGPLSIGLGTVFAASIGSVLFPGSSFLYNVTLYGGAGLFGLFVLHDVDKMRVAAKYSHHYDPINNSLSLYMDIINLFIRIAQMMANSNHRR